MSNFNRLDYLFEQYSTWVETHLKGKYVDKIKTSRLVAIAHAGASSTKLVDKLVSREGVITNQSDRVTASNLLAHSTTDKQVSRILLDL
jgi:hypothetical protein